MTLGSSEKTSKESTPSKSLPGKAEISEVERSLPENTPENPQPTIFRLTDKDIQEHKKYFRVFPVNKEPAQPTLPADFINKETRNSFGDDFEYVKKDAKGETKITENGFLLGGRKYLFSTFTLPGRGKRLYALATEVSKLLGAKDSFVFFVKNKNLFKDVTNEKERAFIEQSGFHVLKTRTRPPSVVNARALFINYGARVICQGKRVIDDYWEGESERQDFTPESQVFPVDRKYYPKNPDKQKQAPLDLEKQQKNSERSFVTPLPPLEDRQEYLISSSSGSVTQTLPGQGITGGLELASVAYLPKYRSDTTSSSRHKSILSTLVVETKSQPAPVTQITNQVPIDDNLAGTKSTNGLPYYSKSVNKRIATEDADKLQEIEYLHGTVETNNIISAVRKQRNRQWGYYWQVKAGVKLGLTKEETDEFLQEQQDSLNEVQQDTIFNEQIQREQIITKRRKPNPNFPGYGNIRGLKAPYMDRPNDNISIPQQQQQQQQQQISGQPQQFSGQPVPGQFPPHLAQQQQQVPYQGLR